MARPSEAAEKLGRDLVDQVMAIDSDPRVASALLVCALESVSDRAMAKMEISDKEMLQLLSSLFDRRGVAIKQG